MHRWLAALLGVALIPLSAADARRPDSKTMTRTDRSALSQLRRDAKRFGDAVRRYRRTVSRIVRRSYGLRRRTILARYRERVGAAERTERLLRRAAITRFESFLRRHARAQRFTPEVLFRLAELHFDEQSDRYLSAMQRYDAAMAKGQSAVGGASAKAPRLPTPHYQRSVALHQQLLRQFPRSRLRVASTYLLGFCLAEMGREAQAMRAFAALVCRNRYAPPLRAKAAARGAPAPSATASATASKSPSKSASYVGCQPMSRAGARVAEAWLRLGEHHFDRAELAPAIAAYAEATRRSRLAPSDLYDKALYKLAWSHYRADHYMAAIKAFDRLVVFADRQKRASGRSGSSLRREALTYLGISFGELDWDGDGNADVTSALARVEPFYRGRRGERHVREVYRELSRVLYASANYKDAIAVSKRMLKHWPLHRDNPALAARVVSAYEQLLLPAQAAKARLGFERMFGARSVWARRHRADAKALASARELVARMLLRAALYHHERAKSSSARPARYLTAARAYDKLLSHIATAPKQIASRRVELSRAMASCYFAARAFDKAARAYATLRDDKSGDSAPADRELAAFMVTKSYEARAATLELSAGRRPVLAPMPRASSRRTAARDLPPIYRAWQRALDRFVKDHGASARAPALAYRAATLDLRAMKLGAARARFASLIARYPTSPLVEHAARALLVSYQIDNKLAAKTRLAALTRWAKVAGAKSLLIGVQFKRVAAEHQRGAALLAAGHKRRGRAVLLRAAKRYLALVTAAPQSADAAAALHNAALCSERAQRIESARRLYDRLAQSYPKSRYVATALWRTALISERLFSFDRALARYLRLARQRSLAGGPRRREAMLAAARILGYGAKHREAAALYQRFALSGAKVDARRSSRAQIEAARSYVAARDLAAALRALRSWKTHFGGAAPAASHIEVAALRADLNRRRGHSRRATRADRLVVRIFAASGLTPQRAPRAAAAAARAAFVLAERGRAALMAARLRGSVAAVMAAFKQLAARARRLEAAYERVYHYKNAVWSVSAACRIGETYQQLAHELERALVAAPPPRSVRRLGRAAVVIYRKKIAAAARARVAPLRRAAHVALQRCIARSRRFGVVTAAVKDARRARRERAPRIELLSP